MRDVHHLLEASPPFQSFDLEATTREPAGDISKDGENVDEERSGGGSNCELFGDCIYDPDQRVIIFSDLVAVGYLQDDRSCCPIGIA